jgi:hypothetical protein
VVARAIRLIAVITTIFIVFWANVQTEAIQVIILVVLLLWSIG